VYYFTTSICMKKIISLLLFAMLVYTSCKKSQNNTPQPPEEKTFPLRFDISGFTITQEDMNGRKVPSQNAENLKLSDYANYLVYFVFNTETQALVKTISQTMPDTAFGRIKDTLPAGRYLVALLASKAQIYPGPNPEIGKVRLTLPGTDVFYKKMILNVDGAVDQTVELDRIVGKLKFIWEDAIPYDTKYVDINFYRPDAQVLDHFKTLGNKFGLNGGGFETALSGFDAYRFNVPDSLRGRQKYQLEFYLPAMSAIKMDVTATAYDTTSVRASSIRIYNVPLTPSKLTVLKGRVFDTLPGGSGVSVGVNGEWARDSTVVNF